LQLEPTSGRPRPTQAAPGRWCRENGVTPPAGSFRSTLGGSVRADVGEPTAAGVS
jgi:phospholipid/cholesterol/gamma-HCH transport system ATP-binding protein